MSQQNQKKTLNQRYKIILNFIIIAISAVVGYFSHTFTQNSILQKPEEIDPQPIAPSQIIQIDVLNGCGAKGIGAKFTQFLRAKGFDVVEMRNYRTFQVKNTLVVDRIGNLDNARTVAKTLGISDSCIIQQYNPDYFVDVSIIIGTDYKVLKPFQLSLEKKN